MTNFNTIKLRFEGAVAVVTLARPPVNAVNREMIGELRTCFDELSENRSIGSVVLSAEGDKAFCGGIDLKERSRERADGAPEGTIKELLDSGSTWRATQHAIRHCSVPVIAAVEGPCIGAGFGMAGVVDIIIASTKARFGLTEINVGLLGGSSKALRMVGPYKARTMFFSGDLVSAEEFYRLGAVEEVVEVGQAESRAIEMATKFAQKSPIALRLAKESILRIEDEPMEDAYRTEQDYTTRLRGYSDSAEAMNAYLERREPVWAWK